MITTPRKSRSTNNQTVLPAYLVQTDLSGKIISVNEGFSDCLGMTPSELFDTALFSYFIQDPLFPNAADWHSFLRDASSFELEVNLTCSTELTLPIKWVVTQIQSRQESKANLQWMGIHVEMEDIGSTPFPSDDIYRNLFDNSPQPMWIYNRQTLRFLDVNEVAIQHYGYSRTEFLSMTIADIRREEERKQLYDHLRRMESINRRDKYLWVHQKKGGDLIVVEIHSHNFSFYGQPARLVIVNDITEKRKNQKILQESEARFRHMADTAPVMIWITDANDKTVYVNKYWSDFTGIKASEALGDGWNKIVAPHDKHIGIDDYRVAFKSRKPISLVYRLKSRTGEYRWVLDNAVPRFLEDGTFLGFIGSVVDINDHKLAEEKIRQQADLIENVSDIIISTDLDMKVITWNRAAENTYGIACSDAIGKRVRSIVTYQFPYSTEQKVLQQIKENGKWNGEVIFHNNSGESVYLQCTISPLTNVKGERIGYIAVNRDITEKVKAEEKIKESEVFFRSLIGNSLGGIALTDINGVMSFIAPSTKNMLGYEPEGLIGQSVFELVHPDDRDNAREQFMNELRNEPKEEYIQVRLKKLNGEWLWCAVRGHNLMHNEYVRSMVIYFNDDTRRKSMEDRLKESEQRFRLLSENSKDIVCLHEVDGSCVYVSTSVTRLLGYIPQQLIGKTPYDLFHPSDISIDTGKRSLRNLKRFISAPVQYRFRKVDGSYLWLETTTQPIYGKNNKIVSLQTTSRDITDRVEVLQELRKKEQEFRNLAENAYSIIQRLDKDLRYTYCNKAVTTIMNVPISDLIGRTVGESANPGTDLQLFIKAAHKVFKEKTLETLKIHIIGKAGKAWDFLVTIAPELNEAGEVESILAISSNITDLVEKEALLLTKEEELLQSNERFELAAKATSDAIWEINIPAGYIFLADEFTDRFGYGVQDLENKEPPWYVERIHSDDRLSVVSKVMQIISKRENFWRDEFRWRSKDGSFKYIHARAYIFYDENGNPYKIIGAIQDISERKKAESKLIQKDILLAAAAQAASDLLIDKELESGISKTLKIIGVAAKVDRAYIFRYHRNDQKGPPYYQQLQEWNSGKYAPQINTPELQYFLEQNYPEIFGVIKEGLPNELLLSNARRPSLKKHMVQQEIKSLLVMPIFVQNNFWGFVGFDQCDYERIWTSMELDILKLFASNLAGAIERKEGERKLVESEIKFRSLFQNSLDIINVLDEQGMIKYVTPSVTTVLAYEESEVMEKNWIDLIHPEDLKRSGKIFAELLQSEEFRAIFDMRVRNKEGKWVWMEVKGINKLKDPIIKGIIISFRDITDRKQSEHQLQGYSEHITNILNSITDGFVALDKDFNVLWWNPIAAQLTGVKDVDVLGKNLWDALPLLKNTRALMECTKAVADKTVVNFEVYIDELKIYFEINGYPSRQGLFVYFKNITTRKAQEMLLTLEKEVLELNANPAATLKNTVDYFLQGIEKLNPGMVCSVLLLDEKGSRVHHLSAPSMAGDFTKLINGMEIGPKAGSCGTAMYQKKTIFVSDICNDPLWEDYKAVAREFNLAACWSFPVVTSSKKVLGSFAGYYNTVKAPSESQIELLGRAATLLGVIIENKQAEQKINSTNARYLLATRATNDAIWDYDLENNHFYWGESFYTLFGYKSNPVTNANGFWESKLHPDDRERVISIYHGALNKMDSEIVYSEYRFLKANGKYALIADRAFIVHNDKGEPIRFVGSMQDITERKKLEKQLIRQEINKQKIIAQAVIDAQEKERAEIGKELHDNVNQILSTAKLYLELAKTDVKQKDELIKRSADSIFNAINEIRNISKALVPPSVKDLGLIDSLKDLVESLRMTKALKVKFSYKGDFDNIISDKQKLMLFRIIQEQVNNVLKHAEASELIIDLKLTDKIINLSIVDNGKGFEVENVKFKKGVGLSNIESRAQLFNGKVAITTAPQKGCRLFIQVPIHHL